MHIELTEMLRCPEPHPEDFLVLSTGEMSGRMVRRGLVGCPVCRREYRIVDGVVYFGGMGKREEGRVGVSPAPPSRFSGPVLQAVLDLSGPGGYVVLLGSATRVAVGLAAAVGGIHCVGVNAPDDLAEQPALSLLRSDVGIPLRRSMARGVVVGAEAASPAWLDEAARVLLRGRRLVAVAGDAAPPGVRRLAAEQGLWVGEKE